MMPISKLKPIFLTLSFVDRTLQLKCETPSRLVRKTAQNGFLADTLRSML